MKNVPSSPCGKKSYHERDKRTGSRKRRRIAAGSFMDKELFSIREKMRRQSLRSLKHHEKRPVNRKRVSRLRKKIHLLVLKKRLLKAPRKTDTRNPGIYSQSILGVDMTKMVIPAFGGPSS